jgi:hypothetical protein
MSFGFSVGDFIAVIELANKIRKDFVGSPSQFKAISDEYAVLATFLNNADSVDGTGPETSRLSFWMSKSPSPIANSTTSKRQSSRRSQIAAEMFLTSWNTH